MAIAKKMTVSSFKETKSTSLWDQIQSRGKEVIDKMKAPLIKKAMRRRLGAAMDDCDTKIIDLNNAILDEYAMLDKMNVNTILNAQSEITHLELGKQRINNIIQELFGE